MKVQIFESKEKTIVNVRIKLELEKGTGIERDFFKEMMSFSVTKAIIMAKENLDKSYYLSKAGRKKGVVQILEKQVTTNMSREMALRLLDKALDGGYIRVFFE